MSPQLRWVVALGVAAVVVAIAVFGIVEGGVVRALALASVPVVLVVAIRLFRRLDA